MILHQFDSRTKCLFFFFIDQFPQNSCHKGLFLFWYLFPVSAFLIDRRLDIFIRLVPADKNFPELRIVLFCDMFKGAP